MNLPGPRRSEGLYRRARGLTFFPLAPEVARPRVLVVAESPLVQNGIAALLARAPELEVEVVATGSDPEAASAADLVVCELAATDRAALERVGELCRATDVLVLISDEESVSELVRAGVKGVLFRETDGERLVRACFSVLSGATVLDEGLLATLLGPRRRERAASALTPRELEVLGLVAEGLSNKLVASRLGISEHTAKFHVNALLEKLGAETRTEAVVLAARQGLLMF